MDITESARNRTGFNIGPEQLPGSFSLSPSVMWVLIRAKAWSSNRGRTLFFFRSIIAVGFFLGKNRMVGLSFVCSFCRLIFESLESSSNLNTFCHN